VGWHCFGNFLLSLGLTCNLQNPPANEKLLPVPEDLSQTLLTNEKQGENDYSMHTRRCSFIKPNLALTGIKMFISMEEPLKN
jgi:hypothetical protein